MDDFDREGTIFLCANVGKVNLREFGDLVGREVLRSLKDLVRDTLWGWSTVGKIVLDTKVLVWS